jgi:hypothetical protein
MWRCADSGARGMGLSCIGHWPPEESGVSPLNLRKCWMKLHAPAVITVAIGL